MIFGWILRNDIHYFTTLFTTFTSDSVVHLSPVLEEQVNTIGMKSHRFFENLPSSSHLLFWISAGLASPTVAIKTAIFLDNRIAKYIR